MPRVLAQATWQEAPPGSLVLVPVGSTEQHGPHLPLDTDVAVADAVVRRAAELVAGETLDRPVLVASDAARSILVWPLDRTGRLRAPAECAPAECR